MVKRTLFCVLILCAALVPPALAQDYDFFFEETDCFFPDLPDVTCGVLIVPEDRSNPDSFEIELAVAIIAAENGNPLPDPVIYLEGGPGGSALFAVQDYLEHPLRENRDLILFDQRGTGFSFPSLNCPEIEEDEVDDPVLACYERLIDEGIDLDMYNSAASAADVNDLRIALGYEQVNLWGISYGTRLALTTIRDYPEGIRAVVIDSVYPPEVNSVEQGGLDSVAAFDAFFAACANDAACSAAYPNLQADFYALVDELNANPAVFEYDDGFEVSEFELIGDDVVNALFLALYDSNVIPMLPYGINLLVNPRDDFDLQDGYDILQGFYTPESWQGIETTFPESVFESDMVLDYLDEFGDISDSEGMYSAVECSEEVVFNDPDVALEAAEQAPEELQAWLIESGEGLLTDCEIFAVAARPALENERVSSDLPVLAISGGYDPVTPPSYADSALEGLPNGQHVVFPAGGHSETGNPGCGADITRQFFDDPSATLDTTCIPQSTDWYVE